MHKLKMRMSNIGEQLDGAVANHNPYTNELAHNLQKVLPDAKVLVGGGYINLYLYGEHAADLKGWLFGILETLPEIDHPIERVNFVVYVNDGMELITLINPSEFDVRALDHAIKSELQFSQPKRPHSNEPLPLDHPYYSDKNHFRK